MFARMLGDKKPKNKFSLENLKYLHGQLVKEPVITNANKARIVEVLRSIAELMIWGDQHNPSYFDFFAEKNILSHFVRILSQKCDAKVKVQIIQTLSILVQNLANEVSIFYLLSNNYINDMIVHRFDFADEEIVTYYINFLKSLSFKLNKRTIIFFYNEHAQDFPLFTEAIKFFNHQDSMIRIAVRTLTLNVFKINDLSLRRYLLTKIAVPYFSHLVWFLRDQTIEYDKLMHTQNASLSKLEVHMEHLLDQLYYIQDVLNCGEGQTEREGGGFTQRDDSKTGDGASGPSDSDVGGLYFQHLISEVLIDQLLGYYVLPLLLGSLVPSQSKIPAHLLISTRLSFFLLNHVFSIFSHFAFLNTIVSVLVKKNLSQLTMRMIQEPPRGPIRNSDGTPLTDVLYPKSASGRRANVAPELTLLTTEPHVQKKRHTMSGSSGGLLATPKPIRLDRDGPLFENPSPTPMDSPDQPDTPSHTAKSLSETELQPITLRPMDDAGSKLSNGDLFEPPAPLEGSSPPSAASSLPSTTEAADHSRDNSLNAMPSSSSTLEFATNPSDSAPATAAPFSPASPTPVDGWVCSQCTLVNPPTFLTCGACESVRPPSPAEIVDPSDTLEAPSTPARPPVIANAGLASAYLSPAAAACASVGAFSSSVPAAGIVTPSKSPPGPREIPVDENSKARSKLPDVGPLYSPIDYFGYVLRSELTASAVASAAAIGRVSPAPLSALASGSFSVPGLTAESVELDSRLLDESEPNEYKAALLRFLSLAQTDCVSMVATSPLHVLGTPAEPDRSQLDERDLYGSLSVIYSVFRLRPDCVDAEMLVQAQLCSQAHRKSSRLLAALMSNASTRDILGLAASPHDPTSSSAADAHRARSDATDALFASPTASDATPDQLEGEEKDETSTRVTSSGDDVSHSKGASFNDLAGEADRLKDESHPSSPAIPSPFDAAPPAEQKMDDVPADPSTPDADQANLPELNMPPLETRSRAESSDPLLQRSTPKRVSKPSPSTRASSHSVSAKAKDSSSSSTSSSTLKIRLFADADDTDSAAQMQLPEPALNTTHALQSASTTHEYNEDFVTSLLSLVNHHPPFRMVTLQTMIELLKEIVLVSDSPSSPAVGASWLLPVHQEQLDRIYLRLVEDLRFKLTQPSWNLFLLDLFEEEYPSATSASPTFGEAGRMLMAKIRFNVQHLLPIETGYSKDTTMDYRVQSSGLLTQAQPAPVLSVVAPANGDVPSPSSAPVASPPLAPTNEIERLRKSVQVLLMLRNLRLKSLHQRDTLFYAPPYAPSSPSAPPLNTTTSLQAVQTQLFHESPLRVSQEILTAHHPDAMLCTLQVEPKKKLHLFFVIDEWDCILVELQQSKPGTAIVQFRQSLRHQEAFLNRSNACLLHVTLRSVTRPHSSARRLNFPGDVFFKPLWVVSLLFLDAIQCARAWKHLDTRRLSLRKNMLGKLCNELNLPIEEEQLQAIAAACTTIQAFPGIEQAVHEDSLLFGIPLPIFPTPASAQPAAATVPAAASVTVAPPAAAPAVAIPVAVPVQSPSSTPAVALSVVEAPAEAAEAAALAPTQS